MRRVMESRFEHRFGDVRVHTDSRAAEAARAINAHAYTVGSNIAFANGRYDPSSQTGRHLLAHELAHVVQQRGAPVAAHGATLSPALGAHERAADAAAGAILAGLPVPAQPRMTARAVARKPATTTAAAALSLGALGIETDIESEPVDDMPVEAMSYSQIRVQIHKYRRWLSKQTQSSPKSAAVEQRLDALQARFKQLDGAPRRRDRQKRHHAHESAPKPRSLTTDLDPRSMSREKVDAELDAISTYLATGPSAAEARKLVLIRSLLDQTAEAGDLQGDETVRRNDIITALATTSGNGDEQMHKTLALIEGITADPDRPGVWLLHRGSMIIPVAEAELGGLKAETRQQLSGIAHQLTKVMVVVWQDWESDKERAHEHKIVHALASWTSGAEDPGNIDRMKQLAIDLRNQVDAKLQAGRFTAALAQIETLQGMVEYEAEKVGKWESDLSKGAGRWVTALTVLKDGLTILATAGAGTLTTGMVRAGSSLLGATATVAGATTVAGAGGAVAGSLTDQAMEGDISLGRSFTAARTGAAQGLVIGGTGGVGALASEAFGVKEAVGTASRIARTVGAGTTSSTAVNVGGALIGGTSVKDAALSGSVGGSLGAFGGMAVKSLTSQPVLSTISHGVVGAASGFAGASVSHGNRLEAALAGAAGGAYTTVNEQLYGPKPTPWPMAGPGGKQLRLSYPSEGGAFRYEAGEQPEANPFAGLSDTELEGAVGGGGKSGALQRINPAAFEAGKFRPSGKFPYGSAAAPAQGPFHGSMGASGVDTEGGFTYHPAEELGVTGDSPSYIVRVGPGGSYADHIFDTLAEAADYAGSLARRGETAIRSDSALPFDWPGGGAGNPVDAVRVFKLPPNLPFIRSGVAPQPESHPGLPGVSYAGGGAQVQLPYGTVKADTVPILEIPIVKRSGLDPR